MAIPFTNTGIAQYPPQGPMIGQNRVRGSLERFLSAPEGSGQDNLFIYGDWGTGKSRIGYQIAAEATGKASGWLCEADTGYENKPLLEDVEPTVLPILITLSDFVNDVDPDTAAYRAFNEAVEQVIDGETEWTSDLNDQLDSYGISELDLQSDRSSGSGPRETFEKYIETIYSSSVDRVAVIVDEVEQVDASTTAPDEVDTAGTSRRRLRAFFQGLKRAVNSFEDEKSFLMVLLATSNLKREVNQIGGFKRRKEEVNIDRPTVDQAIKLTSELADEHGFPVSEEMVKALFFASSNNFGWFSTVMHTMLIEKQQSGVKKNYYDIIQDNPAAFSQIFEEDYITYLEEWDKYPASVRESVLAVIYRLLPVAKDEIASNASEVADVRLPDGIRPIGPMQAVETSRSDIVERLTSDHGFELDTDGDGVVLQHAGDEIKDKFLTDVLDIFRIDEDSVGIYEQQEDLEELTNFIVRGSSTPETVKKVVEMFSEMLDESGETTHYATTIQFLTRWNKAWRKRKGVTRWLSEEKWEELTAEVENITGQGDQEVAEGFALTRFGPGTEIRTNEFGLNSPTVTVDITGDSRVDVVEREEAVILHQPTTVSDVSGLKDDIRTLRQEDERPIVYVLFASQNDQEEHMGALREAFPSFSPFLIDHAIDDTDLTRTFLKRFSFVGEVFDFEEDVRGGHAGRGRFTDKQESLMRRDAEWRQSMEEQGWLQRPLVPKRMEEGPTRYAAGLAHFMRGHDIAKRDVPGVDSGKVAGVWTAAWRDAERLLVPVDENTREFELKPQLPRLLDIIDRTDGVTPDELAGQILYDKEETVSLTLATAQTLTVLEQIGVLLKEGDEYVFAGSDAIQNLGTDAKQHVSAKRGPGDGLLDKYNERMGELVSDFRVTGAIINNEVDQLDGALEDITEVEFSILTEVEGISDEEWCETAITAKDIKDQARRLYNPNLEFRETRVKDYPTELSSDNEYKHYPIHFRLKYLEWLNDHLDNETDELLDAVSKKKREAETTYNTCRGKEFPTAQIETVLEDIEADLSFDESVDLAESLEQETDKSLQGHLDVFEVEEAFDRLEWYKKFLKRDFETDDPWSEFTAAHSTLESVLDQWDQASETVESVKTFVEDSDYEDKLLKSDIDISGDDSSSKNRTIGAEWNKIKKVVENPKKVLEDSAQSTSSLKQDIEQLERMLHHFSAHAKQIKREADEDLKSQRNQLDIEIIESLAKSTGQNVGVDLVDLDEFDRYVDCKARLTEHQEEIQKRGKAILRDEFSGGASCWPLYKKLHRETARGERITSKSLSSKEENQLDKLKDNGIIDCDETIIFNVTL